MSDPCQEWLVEDILPTGEVHLVAGPSGAGKTTWLLQFIKAWSSGDSIFGHASHPAPFAYLAFDRSQKSLERTLKRAGLDPATFPHRSLIGQRSRTMREFVTKVLEVAPDTKVIFIDGLMLVTNPRKGDYNEIGAILSDLVLLAVEFGLTFIGINHSPKTKEKERYLNPRQRVLGSVAWAALAETVIIIEPKVPDDPAVALRSLYLLPRNAPDEVFEMELDHQGLLIQVQKAEAETARFLMGRWLSTLGPDDVFSTGDAKQAGHGFKLAARTVERWLTQAEDSGAVRRVSQGRYRRCLPA